MSDQYFTSTQMRVMTAEAVVVKMTKYGPVKDDEKTRQLRQMLTQAAEVQERAYSERMCSLALGHHSIANKVDRIIVGVDSNGKKSAVAGADYDPADASEDKKAIKELVAALKALAADACGHCDARYCQNDGEQEHMPCRVVYEAQALVRKYSPPEDEATPESDDGMPF